MKARWDRMAPALLAVCCVAAPVMAQGGDKGADSSKATDTTPPREDSSVTEHVAHIGGQTIPYKATIGNILLKNADGDPVALLYYTAYTRSDVHDAAQRPVAFIYNGGPGSASIWLHIGAFGPRRVATRDAEYTPPPPYQLSDNANTLLDKTDMVFIDPVGTGFSHVVGKGKTKDFWGIDQDVSSIGQFINRYVTRNGRWNSPKFLIGESYGTFRSAALGNYLQNHDNMTINGIVLISSVLDVNTIFYPPGNDIDYLVYLPSFAATAWYHKLVKDAPDLPAFVDQARKYAAGDYASALMKGSSITPAEKAAVAAQLARFTGLSEDYIMRADLRVSEPQFTAELLRSRGLTTGRLDARFAGPNGDLLSEFAGSDPQSDAISGAYTAAFNSYIRDELKYSVPDRAYVPLSGEANGAWDWRRNGQSLSSPNTEPDLAQAILTNPNLQVEIENGYFDLATPFFATEYTRDHLGLSPKLVSNIQLKYYMAGHMMYVHDEDLAKLKGNISAFIDRASKPRE
ncbi:MAG TPA: hypothetical protein VHW65_03500 [Gemmatimonadales bacterium]|jgi:carboxypeptidase C (cathepsin A)|nr:hypothetical protein [Gemmatimonadales bacterium]